MSDIQVSVQWKNPTVFAGETIECKIVFKNISQAPSNRRSPSPCPQLLGRISARERWKESLPLQSKSKDSFTSSSPKLNIPRTKLRTHRPAASLGGASHFQTAHGATVKEEPVNGTQFPIHLHRKSVSIVSLTGDAIKGNNVRHAQGDSSRRPGRGHARAASLQVLPRRKGNMTSGPLSGTVCSRYPQLSY